MESARRFACAESRCGVFLGRFLGTVCPPVDCIVVASAAAGAVTTMSELYSGGRRDGEGREVGRGGWRFPRSSGASCFSALDSSFPVPSL